MEEFNICQNCNICFIGKVQNSFNEAKDNIIRTYLKNSDLHEAKKEAIDNILKSSTQEFKKELIYFTEQEQKESKYFFDLFVNEFIKALTFGSIYVDPINNSVLQISNFQDIEFLDFINNFPNSKHNCYFYDSCMNLYIKLKNFADSGIDEKHYYKEVEAIKNKVESIQKYSSLKIELDQIPHHPTDIVRNFMIGHKECLEIVKEVIQKTGARFKGNYTKKPTPTKSEREIIQMYGSVFNHNSTQLTQTLGKTFVQFLENIQENNCPLFLRQ